MKKQQVHHDMISDCWKEAVWKYDTLAKWLQITSMIIIQLVTHKHLFSAKDLSLMDPSCLWEPNTFFVNVLLTNQTNNGELVCLYGEDGPEEYLGKSG